MEFLYHGHSLKGGIYFITNKQNGKKYIGSAKEFKSRGKAHLRSLENQKHHNKYLQAAWNKWGSDNFIFEVVEVIEGDKLVRTTREEELIKEQVELDAWDNCYNLSKWATKKDGPYSLKPKETKSKRSKLMKKKWKDPEYRKKVTNHLSLVETKRTMSKRYKERWENKTDEEKQKVIDRLTAANKGKSLSKIHKKKISKSLKGHSVSVATKQKLKEKNLGKVLSKDTREKMSRTRTGLKNAFAKIYDNIVLISPNGTIYTKIECLSVFARKNNLCAAHLSSLLSGKRKQHKGWTNGKAIYS